MHHIEEHLQKDLNALRAQDLYRHRRTLETAQGVRPVIDGRRYLSFCSNDYLGLAAEPRLAEALAAGAARWGLGSGSAHLVSGHARAHQRLEERLAEFVQRDRALLFSTGYMANLGVIQALVGRGDTLYSDRLNHASLIDGARLSGARHQRFAHADVADLARRMSKQSLVNTRAARNGPVTAESLDPGRGVPVIEQDEQAEGTVDQPGTLIVTDGLFSMDGDLAPLVALAELAQEQNAWLMVDDAHGIGVLGEAGRGSLEVFGLDQQQVPILVGTLGKAFGSFGAFVAGSETLIETLIQRARPYIYTTALPPALAEATGVALELVADAQDRRLHLRALIDRFRRGASALGLPLLPSSTPIQPLIAGDAGRALDWSQALEDQEILVTAIRPPTVPQGSARLRITLSAAHQRADVDRLLTALEVCVTQ